MSMADRLLNRFNSAAQDWGAATENELMPGRTLIRKRDAYYKALRELTEYALGLERTEMELVQENEGLRGDLVELNLQIANLFSDLRKKVREYDEAISEITRLTANVDTLSKEIENRNRLVQMGPDEVGRDYIRRLGIPELTEVFNRLVLGRV